MKIKELTLSAMISAIITVILFFDVKFGYIFSYYLGFILPVPISILVINENKNIAWITCIATFILLFISGNIISLIYVIPSLIIGVFIGILIKDNRVKKNIFIYTGILNLIFVIIQYWFIVYFLKMDQSLVTEAKQIFQMFNIKISQLDILIFVFVGLFVMSILQTIIVLFIIKVVQIRFYRKNNLYFNLTYLQFNRIFGIISLVMITFYFFRDLFTANLFVEFLTAILIALIFVLNISVGGSVIVYYLVKHNKSKLIPLALILGLIPIFLTAYLAIGVFDHFLDFRKRF